MEHFVDRVVSAHDPNVLDHPWSEVKILPRATKEFGMIHHADPILLIHGNVDKVGVGPEKANGTPTMWNKPAKDKKATKKSSIPTLHLESRSQSNILT